MLRRHAELAAALPGAVNVNVTFKQLESLTILRDMRASGLNVIWFDGVATGGGQAVSLGTRVDEAGARQAVLDRLLSETRTALSGVYSVRGQISTAALAALQHDPRVDLVTVPDLANLQQAGGRVKAPPSIYWVR